MVVKKRKRATKKQEEEEEENQVHDNKITSNPIIEYIFKNRYLFKCIVESITKLRGPLDGYVNYRNILSPSWMLKNNYESLLKDKLVNNQPLTVFQDDIWSVCRQVKDKSLFDLFYQKYQDHFYDDHTLEWACNGGNLEIVKMLLDQVKPVVLQRIYTMLGEAMKAKNLELVKYLYKNVDCCKIDGDIYDEDFDLQNWLTENVKVEVGIPVATFILNLVKKIEFDGELDINLFKFGNLTFIKKYLYLIENEIASNLCGYLLDAVIFNSDCNYSQYDQFVIPKILTYALVDVIYVEQKQAIKAKLETLKEEVQQLMEGHPQIDDNQYQHVFNILLAIKLFQHSVMSTGYNIHHLAITILVRLGVVSSKIYAYIFSDTKIIHFQGRLNVGFDTTLEQIKSLQTSFAEAYQGKQLDLTWDNLNNRESIKHILTTQSLGIQDVVTAFSKGDLESIQLILQKVKLDNNTLVIDNDTILEVGCNDEFVESFEELGYSIVLDNAVEDYLFRGGNGRLAKLELKRYSESNSSNVLPTYYGTSLLKNNKQMIEFMEKVYPQYCKYNNNDYLVILMLVKSGTCSTFRQFLKRHEAPASLNLTKLFYFGRDDLLSIYYSMYPPTLNDKVLVDGLMSCVMSGHTRVFEMLQKEYPSVVPINLCGRFIDQAFKFGFFNINLVKYIINTFNQTYKEKFSGKDLIDQLKSKDTDRIFASFCDSK